MRQTFAALAQRRVFFGHQSVGNNLLDGVGVLAEKSGATFRAQPLDPSGKLGSPGLVEAAIGRNNEPLSKLRHFEQLVQGGVGGTADVALFKFCYVDFNPSTDVNALFEEYRRTMAGLRAKYPTTTFVHVTVPLTTLQGGIKAWIKSKLGIPLYGVRENVKRHEFNERLRGAYSGTEPVYDLAKYQAQHPDGRQETFEYEGRTYPSLVPGYTEDGGHLVGEGRTRVAQPLIELLATVRLSGAATAAGVAP